MQQLVIGAILLPIDPRTKGDRLQYVLHDSGAKGIMFTSEFMDNVAPVLKKLSQHPGTWRCLQERHGCMGQSGLGPIFRKFFKDRPCRRRISVPMT